MDHDERRGVAEHEAGARELAPSVPLLAGGKSFGGRMTSQAQAEAPLPGVGGLVFFGFPLHPAKKPATERGDHLARVDVPMLFLQGTRDALAEISLLATVVRHLGATTRFTCRRAQGRATPRSWRGCSIEPGSGCRRCSPGRTDRLHLPVHHPKTVVGRC